MNAATTFEYTSQALPLIATALGRVKKPRILDLGPAVGSNISYFSAFSAKLFIEDLHSIIAEEFETSFPQLIQKLTNYAGHEQFDLVLLWDLLHYLPLPAIEQVLGLLDQTTKPSTHILLMQYTSKKIPLAPSRFTIASQDKVLQHKTSIEEIDVQPYSQNQLKRLLPGLQSKRSVLLRNGMQEVLFSFEE